MCNEVFIGKSWLSYKGSTLTVTGKVKDTSKYYVECSSCSKDLDLYPPLFIMDSTSIRATRSPCGCSRTPRWSKEQYTLRVKRECEIRKFIFHGFGDIWRGHKTKVKLECTIHDRFWDTTDMGHFLGGTGCIDCGKISLGTLRAVSYGDSVRRFKLNTSFKDGVIFTRVDNIKWTYTCPACSIDEYVVEGLCNGVFKTTHSNLLKGVLSCRCSTVYRWTEKQREYQIKNRLISIDGTFLGWVGNKEYIKSEDKFRWTCDKGHNCETSITHFLGNGSGCRDCYLMKERNLNGYYPARVEETDYLYLLDFIIPIKVGRSFDIEGRRTGLRRKSSLYEKPEILQIYTANHQVIYDTEQAIHAELRERGFQHYCNWTTECFTKDCWYILQEILEDYVSSGVLTRLS